MADPGNAMTLDDRVVKVDEAMRKLGISSAEAVFDEFQRLSGTGDD